ncbi:hypothetical protein FGG08_007508 [Glutinoglossum americanum]|uniref:Protein PNS1 n=1 Tax=Glutinoglossum americanum TaxID=1670608 RepID=A0A9P8HTR5_9PEZI|nr:hypothetical protein FGG08_007508 [Glutinoglossum americanum]
MFSEYASRFLAQSQSRISSFRQPQNDTSDPVDRVRRLGGGGGGPSRFPTSRSYLQRPTLGNPYQATASQFSQFPFASRTAGAAPLFYSATDEFREEDDEEEHEREVADYYALQRSRRQFGVSHLTESSEMDEDSSHPSAMDESGGDGREHDERGLGRGRGIRSSWRGGRASGKGRGKQVEALEEEADQDGTDDDLSAKGAGGGGKGRMVDIGLESTLRESLEALERDDSAPPDDIAVDRSMDDDPPAFQQFRRPPASSPRFQKETSFLPQETDQEAVTARPRPPSSDASSVPPTIPPPVAQTPFHDPFWSSLYLISLASLFASFFLVWLHTSAPVGNEPLGDTIYTTLQSSLHLLAVDTLVAVVVSLIWLTLLRSFARPLVYGILVAVPVVLFSFFLYPFISSFKGASLQDKAMRWASFLPAVLAVLWTVTVFKGRHSLNKAIGILQFSCRILAANPALLVLGFATLAGVVIWTWVWISMFTRVFLGGHLSGNPKNLFFVIDVGTWWLGVFFVLMYLWTLAVGSGIQRAATAATVSQWYFHRLAVPSPTSSQVVRAALSHASTTLFGTICFSTFLAIIIRLPLLVLPRSVTGILNLFTYSFVPTPIAALTNPLTLTYAAIHSQPLAASSRGITQMTFLSPSLPTNSLTPRFSRARSGNATSSSSSSPLLPYRLAKLFLHATRAIMAFALGFAGWVSTARTLAVGGHRGSLYAYVVGLIAGAIGWAVLGAMEGVLGGVVDAGVVCWGSESREGGGGGYCLEAGWLFGDEAGR